MPDNNNDAAGVDIGDGSMSICTKHPNKHTHTNPGGICAFCLQDKLGKLVSSSLPIAVFPSSTDSTSNSFRSESTYKTSNVSVSVMFSRSKSTATPSRKYLDGCEDGKLQKRRFWSFWRLRGQNGGVSLLRRRVEKDASPGSNSHVSSTTSFGRKVSRSKSVGCGSRRFSGDFFERISTGLGDRRLRRVESQREVSNKAKVSCVNERVRCGGISQWLHSAGMEARQRVNGKSRSWGWAFASPIRAFSKPSSEKGSSRSDKIIAAPNLSAMPSLLSVGSNSKTNN